MGHFSSSSVWRSGGEEEEKARWEIRKGTMADLAKETYNGGCQPLERMKENEEEKEEVDT